MIFSSTPNTSVQQVPQPPISKSRPSYSVATFFSKNVSTPRSAQVRINKMTSKLSVSYYHPSFLKLNSRIHLLISKDPKVLYLSSENLLDFLSKVYFLSPPSPPQAEKSYSSSRQHFFKKMFSSEREGGGELRMYKAFYQLMFLFIWSILIH